MHFNCALTLFLLYVLNGGITGIAKASECSDNCDDKLKIVIKYEDDSLEDGGKCGGGGAKDTDDGSRVRQLKSRIKKLGEEVRAMFDTKMKLEDDLYDCLRKNGSHGKPKKRRNRKASQNDRRITWACTVCVIQKLCYFSDGGCDYYDERVEDEGEAIEVVEELEKRVCKLKKEKKKLKKEIERLNERLEECKNGGGKPAEPPNKKPKQPLKMKKYIIRTKKVTWKEADRLCRDEHKYLASITSQSDQDALGEARKTQGVTTGQLWVGGYRDSQGKFFWKGQTDTPFTYTNWHSTEPSRWSDEDQNCVESSWAENKFMWFVYECDDEYNYACEYFV